MRYLFVAAAFLFGLLVSDTFAEGTKVSPKTDKDVAADEDQDSGVRHIDTEDVCEKCGQVHSGAGEGEGIPEEESYDENTGLPDVVPSDQEWIH